MSNPVMRFSNNWNNKLELKVFPTIREYNEYNVNKHSKNLGDVYDIELKRKWFCEARLVGMRKWKLKDIPDGLLWLDTGTTDRSKALGIFEMLGLKEESDVLLLLFKKENG